MSSRFRPSTPLRRAFWLALLLFGVIWQPALMMASEVHETAHLFATGHAHDAQHPEAGVPGDEAVDAGGMGWERLMHAGHCCGHSSAMPIPMLAIEVLAPLSPLLPDPEYTVPDTAPSQLLRPPIFG